MITSAHLTILGRVQGVGFRFHMQRQALGLGVTGWVRNRLDGSVEALVQGSPDAVAAMIGWAKRGPASAAVNEVRITEGSGEFTDFQTWPTA